MRPHLLARLFAAPFLGVCTLFLAGCGDGSQGETYPMPIDQMRKTLLDTDAPIQVLGAQAVDWKVAEQGDDGILWTVIDDDRKQLMRFSARMVPVGSGTRVDVDVLPPEGKFQARVAKGIAEHPEIKQLYHVAMAEEIDAKLENRSFDASKIMGPMMRATAANMKSISQSMDDAGEEFRKRDRENIEHAYAQEGRTPARFGDYGEDYDSGRKKFGAPMDNPLDR